MADKAQPIKVGKYPERPDKDALANPKDIEKAEARSEVDQIEDYHKKHPTLKQDKAVAKVQQEQQEG